MKFLESQKTIQQGVDIDLENFFNGKWSGTPEELTKALNEYGLTIYENYGEDGTVDVYNGSQIKVSDHVKKIAETLQIVKKNNLQDDRRDRITQKTILDPQLLGTRQPK